MDRITRELRETLGLFRAAHLFARNYKVAAPSISGSRIAIDEAYRRFEAAIFEGMRTAVDELYESSDDSESNQFLKDEIARLEREDWREALAK